MPSLADATTGDSNDANGSDSNLLDRLSEMNVRKMQPMGLSGGPAWGPALQSVWLLALASGAGGRGGEAEAEDGAEGDQPAKAAKRELLLVAGCWFNLRYSLSFEYEYHACVSACSSAQHCWLQSSLLFHHTVAFH